MDLTEGEPAPLSIEAQRLALDTRIQEARLALDAKIQEAHLEMDKSRDKRESKLFRANAAVIVTSLIAAMTVFISATQFYFTFKQSQEKEHYAEVQDAQNTVRDNEKYNADLEQRLNEQRLKILSYLTENKDHIFVDEDKIKRVFRNIMIAALSKEQVQTVFEQLHNSIPNDKIWIIGQITSKWEPAGIGDCPGRDVPGGGTEGVEPVKARCDTNFEGRVAVCWDGQKYKSSGSNSKWCTYKVATPETCSGGASPGIMYRCSIVIQESSEAK